jgi:hypothetical protein
MQASVAWHASRNPRDHMLLDPGYLDSVLDLYNGVMIRCPGRQQPRRCGSRSTQATYFDMLHCGLGTPCFVSESNWLPILHHWKRGLKHDA